jgi:hypothetical protein
MCERCTFGNEAPAALYGAFDTLCAIIDIACKTVNERTNTYANYIYISLSLFLCLRLVTYVDGGGCFCTTGFELAMRQSMTIDANETQLTAAVENIQYR